MTEPGAQFGTPGPQNRRSPCCPARIWSHAATDSATNSTINVISVNRRTSPEASRGTLAP